MNNDKVKETLIKMTKGTAEALESLSPAMKASTDLIDEFLTPEMEKNLTAEQRDLLNSAKGAFKLDGLDIIDKVSKLTKTIKEDVSNNNG